MAKEQPFGDQQTQVFIHGLKYEVNAYNEEACFYIENIEETSSTINKENKRFLWQSQKWFVTLYDVAELPVVKRKGRLVKREIRRRRRVENESDPFEVTEVISLDVKETFSLTSHLREYIWKPKNVNIEESYILVVYVEDEAEEEDRNDLLSKRKPSSSYGVNTSALDFESTYDDYLESMGDYNKEKPQGALARLTYLSEKLLYVNKKENEETSDEEFYEIEPINIKLSFEPAITWMNPYEGKYGLSTSHFQLSERFGDSYESRLLKITTRGGYLSDFSLSYSEAKQIKTLRKINERKRATYNEIPADTIIIDKLERLNEEEANDEEILKKSSPIISSDDEGFEEICLPDEKMTTSKPVVEKVQINMTSSTPKSEKLRLKDLVTDEKSAIENNTFNTLDSAIGIENTNEEEEYPEEFIRYKNLHFDEITKRNEATKIENFEEIILLKPKNVQLKCISKQSTVEPVSTYQPVSVMQLPIAEVIRKNDSLQPSPNVHDMRAYKRSIVNEDILPAIHKNDFTIPFETMQNLENSQKHKVKAKMENVDDLSFKTFSNELHFDGISNRKESVKTENFDEIILQKPKDLHLKCISKQNTDKYTYQPVSVMQLPKAEIIDKNDSFQPSPKVHDMRAYKRSIVSEDILPAIHNDDFTIPFETMHNLDNPQKHKAKTVIQNEDDLSFKTFSNELNLSSFSLVGNKIDDEVILSKSDRELRIPKPMIDNKAILLDRPIALTPTVYIEAVNTETSVKTYVLSDTDEVDELPIYSLEYQNKPKITFDQLSTENNVSEIQKKSLVITSAPQAANKLSGKTAENIDIGIDFADGKTMIDEIDENFIPVSNQYIHLTVDEESIKEINPCRVKYTKDLTQDSNKNHIDIMKPLQLTPVDDRMVETKIKNIKSCSKSEVVSEENAEELMVNKVENAQFKLFDEDDDPFDQFEKKLSSIDDNFNKRDVKTKNENLAKIKLDLNNARSEQDYWDEDEIDRLTVKDDELVTSQEQLNNSKLPSLTSRELVEPKTQKILKISDANDENSELSKKDVIKNDARKISDTSVTNNDGDNISITSQKGKRKTLKKKAKSIMLSPFKKRSSQSSPIVDEDKKSNSLPAKTTKTMYQKMKSKAYKVSHSQEKKVIEVPVTSISQRIELLRQNSSDNLLDERESVTIRRHEALRQRKERPRSQSIGSILDQMSSSKETEKENEMKERRRRLAGYSFVNSEFKPSTHITKSRDYSIDACAKEVEKERTFIKIERQKAVKRSNRNNMGTSIEKIEKMKNLGRVDIPEVFHKSTDNILSSKENKEKFVGRISIPRAFSMDNILVDAETVKRLEMLI